MNKYWANKLDDLIHSADNDMTYASSKDCEEILEGLIDDVERLMKDKYFPLPKYIAVEFRKALDSFNEDKFMDVDSFLEEVLRPKAERLRNMMDESGAHDAFLKSIGPLMAKEDEPARREQFSSYVDSLVRNGEVEEDVAKEWGQPIEFL